MAIKEFLVHCVPMEEANRSWVIQIFNFILEWSFLIATFESDKVNEHSARIAIFKDLAFAREPLRMRKVEFEAAWPGTHENEHSEDSRL